MARTRVQISSSTSSSTWRCSSSISFLCEALTMRTAAVPSLRTCSSSALCCTCTQATCYEHRSTTGHDHCRSFIDCGAQTQARPWQYTDQIDSVALSVAVLGSGHARGPAESCPARAHSAQVAHLEFVHTLLVHELSRLCLRNIAGPFSPRCAACNAHRTHLSMIDTECFISRKNSYCSCLKVCNASHALRLRHCTAPHLRNCALLLPHRLLRTL